MMSILQSNGILKRNTLRVAPHSGKNISAVVNLAAYFRTLLQNLKQLLIFYLSHSWIQ